MNLSKLNFVDQGPELIWKDGPLSQVIYRVGSKKIHSYCQICLDSLTEVDGQKFSGVILCISWHDAIPVFLGSWDLISTNRAVKLSKPSGDIPIQAVDILKELRTSKSVSRWLEQWDGAKPPNYYWLRAIADYWAGDKKGSLMMIDSYIKHYKEGTEMFKDGLELRGYITKLL